MRQRQEDEERLQGLLGELNSTLQRIKQQEEYSGGDSAKLEAIQSENQELRLELNSERTKVTRAEMRVEFLERELRSKCELNEQLTESVHRARNALNEERERRENLDRKLESEQRAARYNVFFTCN